MSTHRIALATLIASAGVASAQTLYVSDFEADDGGLAATGDWQWGMPNGFAGAPFGGPEPVGGNSGDMAWGTIIGGAHNPSTTSTLTLSGLDLTSAVSLSFFEYSESGGNTFDMARVFVGGTEVYLSDGNSGLAWREVTIDLTGFSGTQDIVWQYDATGVVERVGWYIDDVTVAVPSPAGAAVLAMGGLLATRRRR